MPSWRSARRPRLAREDGFTIVELLVALIVLVVGILGAAAAFSSSEKLSLVNERHAAMAQIAQREIEQIEGLTYQQVGLQCGATNQPACPQHSADPTNPNYYVSSDGTTLTWDRTGGSSEPIDISATNGSVTPVQTWSQSSDGGLLGGQIYDFVTWSTDSRCSPGCPASQDYKRVTVAVTMTTGLQPTPVYVSSVISDPNAGTKSPDPPPPTCQTGSGTTGPCNSPISCQTGQCNANTYFLHDWLAHLSGLPQPPASNHVTHPTVAVSSGGVCTSNNVSGCPTPDLMDVNPPTGTSLYDYATDQCPVSQACFPGGREVSSSGTGTGSPSNCSNGAWGSLTNNSSGFWVTPPLSPAMTLTGVGGLTVYTQTINPGGSPPSVDPTVTYCLEIYDVPPDGAAGSLSDILAYPPVAKGGAAYVPPSNPSTGGNLATTLNQVSFIFTFSAQPVTIASGDRIGLRIWEESEPAGAPIDLMYDTVTYPSQLQLNSQ